MAEDRAKFTRALPAQRREALIRATAACLAERGAAATSVRAVALAAGVSPGLIRHYFGGMDALVAETYRSIGARVQQALEAALAAAEPAPEAQLRAVVRANFRPPILDPELLATWLAFWSLVRRRPDIKAVHGAIYGAYRARLEALIAAAAAARGLAIEPGPAALALTALLDGLWLELCLDPSTFTAEDAVGIGERWLDGLLAGD